MNLPALLLVHLRRQNMACACLRLPAGPCAIVLPAASSPHIHDGFSPPDGPAASGCCSCSSGCCCCCGSPCSPFPFLLLLAPRWFSAALRAPRWCGALLFFFKKEISLNRELSCLAGPSLYFTMSPFHAMWNLIHLLISPAARCRAVGPLFLPSLITTSSASSSLRQPLGRPLRPSPASCTYPPNLPGC